MVKYWFQDHNELLDIDKYTIIIPTTKMSYIENVNSLVRLSIVVGLLLSFVLLNINFLLIPLLAFIITYLVYKYRVEKYKQLLENEKLSVVKQNNFKNIKAPETEYASTLLDDDVLDEYKEYLDISTCTPPTSNNVYMNPLPFDDRKRYKACKYNKHTKSQIEALHDQIPTDTGNVFKKYNSNLVFHTIPNTTYPNEQNEFAQWVYGTPASCKEGNGEQCYNNMYHGLHSKLGGHSNYYN